MTLDRRIGEKRALTARERERGETETGRDANEGEEMENSIVCPCSNRTNLTLFSHFYLLSIFLCVSLRFKFWFYGLPVGEVTAYDLRLYLESIKLSHAYNMELMNS